MHATAPSTRTVHTHCKHTGTRGMQFVNVHCCRVPSLAVVTSATPATDATTSQEKVSETHSIHNCQLIRSRVGLGIQ